MTVCQSTSMLNVSPPSLASHAPTGNGYIWKRLVGCQAAIASRLAPTIGPGPSVRDWLAVRPPSLASQAPTGNGDIWKRLVGCQAAIAGKPCSYRDWVHLEEIGWLSGRHRWQAKLLQGLGTSGRDWSAVRPPSLASQAPTGTGCIWKRLVGCQAAIAGKPSSYRDWVHLEEIGRLSGRHRWQAKLLQGMGTSGRDWSAVRPPSLASQAPTGNEYTGRFSPLIRPSVSSPSALDLDPPAPSGG